MPNSFVVLKRASILSQMNDIICGCKHIIVTMYQIKIQGSINTPVCQLLHCNANNADFLDGGLDASLGARHRKGVVIV